MPVKLLYLATEFTDFIQCDLISIALVSECGKHEFYAERNDYIKSDCSDFVKEFVIPHLGKVEPINRAELKKQLFEFIENIGEEVTIACDFRGDLDLLNDALDGNNPKNLLNQWYDFSDLTDSHIFYFAGTEYYQSGNYPRHHALHDARAHRLGDLAFKKSKL